MESDAVQREIENNDVPYNNSRKTISISTDKLEDIDQYKKPSCSYKDISDSQTVNKPSVSVVNEQAFHIQDNVGKFSSRDEIQLKCMNCGGNLTQRRHKINFGVVEEMIRKWIAPQVIEKSTILCHSCWKLSFVDYNEPEMSEKTYYSDHRRVCKDDRSQFRTKPSTVPSDAHTQLSIRYTMIEWRKNKKARKTKSASLEGEDGLQRPSRSTSTPARASWACPLEFILACLGYAVGLGNVWRFPYLCYRNGGGAFLIPFFLMLIFIGLPIFYLELYIGQYTGMGPLKAFSSIAPFFSGLGYCTLVVITIIQIYYMIIVAWTLFYTFVSLGGHLGWGLCDNKYNTKFCYSGEYDHACRINNTGGANDLTYYLRQCMSIGEICIATGFQPYDHKYCLDGTEKVPWYSNVTRKLAAEEYYNERVLGRGDATWSNWGTIQWHLVGTLFLSWLTAFCCVIKGVQSAGKVVYFTALFPYVMLTALLIRGVTLEGAEEGILFYLSPNWGTLLEARVWGDAASQIFYSFGVACGSLVTLASYNNFHNNCHFDACFVSFANFGTSIYAGFAIFSVLGFQARQMGVSVDDVAEQGPGLAFVAYPEALLQMPVPQFWSIMFFFMLFILGLGSQFAGIEAINTAIVDRWPHLRKNYWKITAFTCFSCFILGLPMCFSGGVYLFTLLDWNTASWAILILGMAESASVSWCYGIKRAMSDLETMGMTFNKFLRFYWTLVWTVIVPFGSIGILIFIFKDWQSPEFEGYVFPVFAELLGWCVGLSTLVLLPVGVAWAYYYGYRGKALFSPTPSWKAAKKTTNEPSDPSIKPPAIILNPL